MGAVYTKEELKQRLGPPDIVQIRLLLRVPPERRVQTAQRMKRTVLYMWRDRLRKSRSELNDLELWQLIFRRLKRNG